MADGRYDYYSESLLKKFGADAVLLIVVSGDKGHGFSISTVRPELLKVVPDMLRTVANDIEEQAALQGAKPS